MRSAIDPVVLVERFEACVAAQEAALATLGVRDRRARTERPEQYALDLVADAAILPLLHDLGVRVLSEESGWSGPEEAATTVVLDPVDGSTNCARGIPYWGISLCALDAEGPLCGLVSNGATGQRFHAVRGAGAWCDGDRLASAGTERVADALVAVTGLPTEPLGWRQVRELGSTALALCGVATGGIDALVDFVDAQSVWDYLGGLVIAREAGATVMDLHDRDLLALDPDATRRLVAGATPSLVDEVVAAILPVP